MSFAKTHLCSSNQQSAKTPAFTEVLAVADACFSLTWSTQTQQDTKPGLQSCTGEACHSSFMLCVMAMRPFQTRCGSSWKQTFWIGSVSLKVWVDGVGQSTKTLLHHGSNKGHADKQSSTVNVKPYGNWGKAYLSFLVNVCALWNLYASVWGEKNLPDKLDHHLLLVIA